MLVVLSGAAYTASFIVVGGVAMDSGAPLPPGAIR
jgi:hypothetical protein